MLAGQAKVTGTVLCVGGSMKMTFYKGNLVKIWSSHIHWRYAENITSSSGFGGGHNMALGAALIIASCTTWAIWFIIQCLVIGAGVERKLSAWSLGWDIRLAASLYVGMVRSGLAVSLMSWRIEKKGPLYVSMFSPLQLIFVTVLGWAILDEKLYVGRCMVTAVRPVPVRIYIVWRWVISVTGSILIVVGLYLVFLGKGRELKKPSNIGGKNMEEELEKGGGSTVAISMPKYCSPGHEDQDAKPQDVGVEVSHGSPN